MEFTELQLLRKELADPYKTAFDENSGDGNTTIFKLSHGNLATYEVFLDDVIRVEDTHYTMNSEEGVVKFLVPPEDGVSIEVTYRFSAFSDAELEEFLSSEGSISGALLRCVDILLMDSARRFDYSVGRADLKPSQVFDNLLRLRDVVEKRIQKNKAPKGGLKVANRSNRYYKKAREVETDLSRADL